MQLEMKPGTYVVAVSGGVDSMVLLHILATLPDVKVVVAHFNHGIREDSAEDERLVKKTAHDLGVPFECGYGHLDAQASEATARATRYKFLSTVVATYRADALITAHHQDDVIETAFINVLRGTGRKGLTALGANTQVLRPLLPVPKRDIIAYAEKYGITWREDSTNAEDRYLRNYIRHMVVPKMTGEQRHTLLRYITHLNAVNAQIDRVLTAELKRHTLTVELDRKWFIMLPHAVATETMAAWLRHNEVRDFDRRTVQRLTVAAKTARPGKRVDVQAGHHLQIDKDIITFLFGSPS